MSHRLSILPRFCQVPTFGNGIIRRFANNTSDMKRLAARDFEDILQVFPIILFVIMVADTLAISVLSQSSKGCFLPSMMQSCSLYYIDLHNGTRLPSLGFSQNLLWLFSKRHSNSSLGSCGSFNIIPVLLSVLWSYQKRRRLANAGSLSALN